MRLTARTPPTHRPVCPRVLVVAASPLVRESVREALLADDAIRVLDLESTLAGVLRRFVREPPHLVVIDVDMPERVGLQVLDALATSRPSAPVIALTAVTADESALALRGAAKILRVPTSRDEALEWRGAILGAVRELLREERKKGALGA